MPTQRQVAVRRAPKYVPFLVAGGLVGAVIAAVTSYSVPAPKDYTQGSVFGYFLILFAAAGVLVGGVVALVLDRILLRRTEHAIVEEVEDDEDVADVADDTEPREPETSPEAHAPGEAEHDGEHAPSAAEGPESGPAPAP